MPTRILICGAGQLGSRYLQGMAKCSKSLKIFVYDSVFSSLINATKRWNEVQNSYDHDVLFVKSLKEVDKKIDIAIVSTTSDARLSATKNISNNLSVENWIFEKVLTQNEAELDRLISLTSISKAWVNTPRRMMNWHNEIKNNFDYNCPMKFSVRGGSWGMACNAIHFLDLFSWWSGESIDSISIEELNKAWFQSKRDGFWEVLGGLSVKFSNGSVADIFSDESINPVLIKVDGIEDYAKNPSWIINETDGLAKRSDGLIVTGKINYQSDITSTLIDSILDTGDCSLPSLKISAELHRIFISKMLEHWNKNKNPKEKYVPIT